MNVVAIVADAKKKGGNKKCVENKQIIIGRRMRRGLTVRYATQVDPRYL